ncbi:MAG: hypothetical protein IPK68_03535 [Bdellovibrionales bacterium]|nr:hypothetical protein [Bdellovibrionales bacterium]
MQIFYHLSMNLIAIALVLCVPCRAGALGGISEKAFVKGTLEHIEEIQVAGRFLLENHSVYRDWFTMSEWQVLEYHLRSFLEVHDLPKIWDRNELTRWGYPEHLPVVKAVLSVTHGIARSRLPEGHVFFKVLAAMNATESTYKKAWMNQNEIDHQSAITLKRVEYILDVIVTKMSIKRAEEMGFSYKKYDATDWLINPRVPLNQTYNYRAEVDFILRFERDFHNYLLVQSNQYRWRHPLSSGLNIRKHLGNYRRKNKIKKSCRSDLAYSGFESRNMPTANE